MHTWSDSKFLSLTFFWQLSVRSSSTVMILSIVSLIDDLMLLCYFSEIVILTM